MNRITQILMRKNQEIVQIEAPSNLEARLTLALDKTKPLPANNRRWIPGVAVACLLILLIGWQTDSLAYIGKKLIGYEKVMNGTLRQLNEMGRGQTIGKSSTLSNHNCITLDAILLDDNQLLAYFTIKSPKGNLDEISIGPGLLIRGKLLSYHMNHAQGEIDYDNNEIKYVASFDPPLWLEKNMKLIYEDRENLETTSISFTIDRNEAMGCTLKKDLKQTVTSGSATIRFDTITASPTVTVINGMIQNPLELVRDQIIGERIRPGRIDFQLVANGNELSQQSSGLSTDVKGITFSNQFDALPEGLKSLQIKLNSFCADYDVNQTITVEKDKSDQEYSILQQQIIVNDVSESGGDTYLNLTTQESVVLTKVCMIIDGQKVSLEDTSSDKYEKKTNGTILHTRILHFKGKGRELQLCIERMTCSQPCDKVIDIPLD